jgi:chemotaxis methyl-accepting protein methylase
VPSLETISLRYRLVVPILFLIAAFVHLKKMWVAMRGTTLRTNFWLVDGVSRSSRMVKEGAAKWRALDVVYNFASGVGHTRLRRVIDDFWLRIRNAQAVRNRLKIAKSKLREAILSVAATRQDDDPIRILSLASGSAQGVIETLAEFRNLGLDIEVLLVDQDTSALAHARRLAREHNVEDKVITREGDVIFFDRVSRGYKPDIIEMLGLMDYLRTSLAVKLVRKIYSALNAGGRFLTCHVHPNSESYFLRHVVDWDMIYRPLGEFHDILVEGKFLHPAFFTEPHGIHSVAVCEKPL